MTDQYRCKPIRQHILSRNLLCVLLALSLDSFAAPEASSAPAGTEGPVTPSAAPSGEGAAPTPQIPEGRPANLKPTASIAHLIRSKKEGSIAHLEIQETKLPVVMIHSDLRFRPMVEVAIRFDRPGWTLLIQGKTPVTKTAEPGRFKVFAYLNSHINEMLLVARSTSGETESERLYIYAPEAQEFKVVAPWDAVKLTVGSTYLSYQQTRYNDFYSWSGLLLAQIHSPEAPSRFGFLGELSMTALSVTSNHERYGPQIGHGIIDGVYFFSWTTHSLWRFQGLAGANYLTMFSNGAPFGFQNLITPDFGLRTRRILDANSDIITEFRLVPMSLSLDFNEMQISLAVSKSWILPNLHRGEVGVKYHQLQYHPNASESISLKTFSFTLGYSL